MKATFLWGALLVAVLMNVFAIGARAATGSVYTDKPVKRDRWVGNVHDPIPVDGLTHQQIRLAILKGMYETRGFSWQLERETENIITARFDYRQSAIIFDIVYDAASIRLLFVDGNNKHECEELIDGICYANQREYYNYSKNLRASIANEIKRARMSK